MTARIFEKYRGGCLARTGVNGGDAAIKIASLVLVWIFSVDIKGSTYLPVARLALFLPWQMARRHIRIVQPSGTFTADCLQCSED